MEERMKDPKLSYLNDLRYESDGEYLASIFVLVDLWIFRDSDSRMKAWGLSPEQDPLEWLEIVGERAEMTLLSGGHLAMEELLTKLNAPLRMRLLLGFFLRCALDPSYEASCAAELGRTSLNLFELARFFSVEEEREDPAAVFRNLQECRYYLDILFPQLTRRETSSGFNIATMMPLMDGRLMSLLMGEDREKELPCGMELFSPVARTENPVTDQSEMNSYELLFSGAETEGSLKKESEESTCEPEEISKYATLLQKRAESMPEEIAVLWGREGSGKHTVMRAYADRISRELLFYSLAGGGKSSEEGNETLPLEEGTTERLYRELLLLRRECVLYGCIPVLTGAGRLSKGELLELQVFLRRYFLPITGNVYILMEAEEEPDYLPNCYFLSMPEKTGAERIRLWKSVLPEESDISSEGIEALANTFNLTPGQIRDVADQAVLLSGPEEKVTEDLLYQVCYAKLGHPLKGHSQRVRSPFVWDDLKMDASDKAILRDLCECVRNRHKVMQEWNFQKRVPYGSGITALFAGPPGTGKTMAAQVIANELRMELYKVDLSQLIDKYVGETEKNIKRVFELAGRSNSVLFFDEADAIFNKRLEADNSNDRFANIESSLLLQCIEEFSGVTLLATNNMGNMDIAFRRRFRFYLLFKEPDEEIRYQIWKSVFPPEAPVKPEVDFRELANLFSFTGAVTKNVAMQAAYLAAERGEGIGALEIMVAVRREMQKEQRMLSRDTMGKYGKLYPDVINWNSDQKKGDEQ